MIFGGISSISGQQFGSIYNKFPIVYYRVGFEDRSWLRAGDFTPRLKNILPPGYNGDEVPE
jgi:hypothetical protein